MMSFECFAKESFKQIAADLIPLIVGGGTLREPPKFEKGHRSVAVSEPSYVIE
jgi:hypothetical protein